MHYYTAIRSEIQSPQRSVMKYCEILLHVGEADLKGFVRNDDDTNYLTRLKTESRHTAVMLCLHDAIDRGDRLHRVNID